MNFRTLALAAALAIVPTTAFAGPTSAAVTYSDLDLSTPQGMAKLDKRIERAAKSVCSRHEVITGSITSTTTDQKCYQDALAKLKDQVAALTERKQQG
jgi:UrcA family protein